MSRKKKDLPVFGGLITSPRPERGIILSTNQSPSSCLLRASEEGFTLGKLTVDRIAVTTNIGGSSGWKPEYKYGRYFFGKILVKLGDNAAAGRLHDEAVCGDVAKYAREVFTLALPVGEGEDVSDFLETNPVEALLKLLPNRVFLENPDSI